MLMTLNSVWKLVSWCQWGSQVGLNDFLYRVSAIAGTGADHTDFQTAMGTIFAAQYAPLMHDQAAFQGTTLSQQHPVPGGAFVSPQTLTPGTAVGDPMPGQICGFVRKRTNVPGRRGNGRFYVPFPAEDDNTIAGQPSALYKTGAGTLGAAVIGPIVVGTMPNQSTMTLCVARMGDFTDLQDVVSCPVSNLWANQRRRSSFGRTNRTPWS